MGSTKIYLEVSHRINAGPSLGSKMEQEGNFVERLVDKDRELVKCNLALSILSI